MNPIINRGTWSGDCTTENDLVSNQIKYPAIRKMLEYTDQRMISTLLVKGKIGPYGIDGSQANESKIQTLDQSGGKMIADNALRFSVMGRIQKESVIKSQVGATSTDGVFQLLMADNYLVPGMNVTFYAGTTFLARVVSEPVGTAGNYTYTFQSIGNTVFNWTTHVSGQPGNYTCFGGYTSYGEASTRGYGRSHFPDTYINHTTIQRKSISITGSALSDVLWYEVESENGPIKGWMYEALQQAKAQFLMECEYNRLFGRTNMKDSNGNLLSVAPVDNAGNPIVMGSGIEEQIEGGNEIYGSGTSGQMTYDDLRDMLKTMRLESNMMSGLSYVFITGEDGFSNAQDVMGVANVNNNVQLFKNVADTNAAGGATPDAGVTYQKFNVDGDTVFFIKHPMFDDALRFPKRGSDGKLIMSSTYYGFTIGEGAAKNMDVFSKGGKNGVNRSMVEADFNGMTGSAGSIMSEEDAKKYAMLKEDMLVIYNTSKCGIIRKTA
jgi:hypothetical protein